MTQRRKDFKTNKPESMIPRKFPVVVRDWIIYIRITKNTTWYLGIPPYFVIGSRWASDNGCSIEDEWMDGIDAILFGLGILLAVFGIALQILVWIYL